MRRCALAALLALTACGSDPAAPAVDAELRVRLQALGPWPQTGPYRIVLDGRATARFIRPGETVPLQVPSGVRRVSLEELPAWCGAGEEVEVEASSQLPATASLTVTCTGAALTLVTTGVLPDPDGYEVLVDGEPVGTVEANGTAVAGAVPGRRVVTLDGLSAHCRPAQASWTIDLAATGTPPQRIDVSCPSARVTAEVTQAGGDFDADGFLATLQATDFGVPGGGPVAKRGVAQIALGALPAGADYTVVLSEAAANCRIEQTARSGRVAATDTAIVLPFAVTCTVLPPGILYSVFEDAGVASIYRLAEPLGPQRLTGGTDAAWAPDGISYVFVSSTTRNIIIASRNGGPTRQLGRGLQPVFAPDQRSVFYLPEYDCPFGCDYPEEVRRFSLDTGTDEVAFRDGEISGFDISPDGARIAVNRCVDTCELVVANLDGSGARVLLRTDATVRPRFSPDGREIAVMANSPFFGLVIVPTDGGASRSFSRTSLSPVAWSPDGSRIAYAETSGFYITELLTARSSDGGDARIVSGGLASFASIDAISWR